MRLLRLVLLAPSLVALVAAAACVSKPPVKPPPWRADTVPPVASQGAGVIAPVDGRAPRAG